MQGQIDWSMWEEDNRAASRPRSLRDRTLKDAISGDLLLRIQMTEPSDIKTGAVCVPLVP